MVDWRFTAQGGIVVKPGRTYASLRCKCRRFWIIAGLTTAFAMAADEPMLQTAMYVTAPRPPLLTTAGIVRILAKPPTKADTKLEIRIPATHLAPRRPNL